MRFFVAAADEEELTRKFVERDFVSIPTFDQETNSFVYAVPKNHRQNDADRALKEKAARILAVYRSRRAAYIGTDKKGVVERLREWFCDNSNCSPENARLEYVNLSNENDRSLKESFRLTSRLSRSLKIGNRALILINN